MLAWSIHRFIPSEIAPGYGGISPGYGGISPGYGRIAPGYGGIDWVDTPACLDDLKLIKFSEKSPSFKT